MALVNFKGAFWKWCEQLHPGMAKAYSSFLDDMKMNAFNTEPVRL